jgi:hypothetical protein
MVVPAVRWKVEMPGELDITRVLFDEINLPG